MQKKLICLSIVIFIAIVSGYTVPTQRKGYEIEPTSINPEIVSQWMVNHGLEPFSEKETMSSAFSKFFKLLKNYATETLKELDNSQGIEDQMLVENKRQKRTQSQASDYPFWQFIPRELGLLRPATSISWQGPCFQNSSASATLNSDGSIDIDMTFENPKDLLCADALLLGTVEKFSVQEIVTRGTKKVSWSVSKNATDGQKWDLDTNGIRLFIFGESWANVLVSVTDTAELFEPCATKGVLPLAAEKNLKFLKNYSGIDMVKRNVTDVVLDKSLIQNGDFFGVVRLDGLDPMLAWGMGSATGHTTMALWGDDGELYVCESTATTSYWDINGIQKTPYTEWLQKAKAADFQVVHVPLAPEYRAKFNATAAWEFFNSTEGVDYGYHTLLWGWVDTVKDNYPCAPPNFERCLSWNIIAVAFPQIEKVTALFTELYQQAWNLRIGTSGLAFAEILQAASAQGISGETIPTIVEDDKWMYNTTRYGKPASAPSMVCCVFVCHMWKSGGLFSDFDSDVNCGELTNWDDHVLKIFDSNYVRPQQCVDADPNNQACQLLGEYTLNLNDYNTKAPYRRMDERCPSLPPSYTRDPTC